MALKSDRLNPIRNWAIARLQRRLARDEKGVAAIEFAFIAPIMILMLVGTVDMSGAVALNWRMVQLNRTLTDLSSQSASLSTADLNNIFTASASVLSPYRGPAPKMVISSLVIDSGKIARVCWSDARNGGVALARGSVVSLPNTDMATPNTSLIMATTALSFSGIFTPDFPMSAKPLYFRPRIGDRSTNVEQVVREGVAACPAT